MDKSFPVFEAMLVVARGQAVNAACLIGPGGDAGGETELPTAEVS